MDAVSPVLEYEVPATLIRNAPLRYISYPVTPTLSVEAVHDRLICDEEIAVAERLVGGVGMVVSEACVTVTVTLWFVVPPVPVQESV